MEPIVGQVRDWLMASTSSSGGTGSTQYLLARELSPPIAFVLHLCTLWTPEVVLLLIAIGLLAVVVMGQWVIFKLLRSFARVLRWLVSLSSAPSSEVSTPTRSTPNRPNLSTASQVPAISSSSQGWPSALPAAPTITPTSASLTADREARLRALLGTTLDREFDQDLDPPSHPELTRRSRVANPASRPPSVPYRTRSRSASPPSSSPLDGEKRHRSEKRRR